MKLFKSTIFLRFGTPRVVISDGGSHFRKSTFKSLLENHGVRHNTALAYQPKTSGQVEVSNRQNKAILEKVTSKNRNDWSKKLPDVLWALRMAYKTPLGTTPYKLEYDKACHLPVALEHKAWWALTKMNFDFDAAGEVRFLQMNELEELRLKAYESSKIYKDQTKKWHDAKILKKNIGVGDLVLLLYSKMKVFPGKLRSRWSGPFIVMGISPYGAFELSSEEGETFKVNGQRVKHNYEGDDKGPIELLYLGEPLPEEETS
ncbi:uncharacterized protein LOC141614033 [Silene latifolia]|uniref:uncharacterized protein LOC141614033 n=1 Tax=Silene latifolia TaxID=37657 RepID=UPI003D78774F